MFTNGSGILSQHAQATRASSKFGATPVFEPLEHRLLLSGVDPAVKDLIGVNEYMVYPQIHYTGQVGYDAGTQAFDLDATPFGALLPAWTYVQPHQILAEIGVSSRGDYGWDEITHYLSLDDTEPWCRKLSQTQFDALDKTGSEFETPPASYVADANPNVFYYMFEDTPGFAPDSNRDFNDFMVKVEINEATNQATLTPWDLPGSPYQMFLVDPDSGQDLFDPLNPAPIPQWPETAQPIVVSGTNTASLDLHIQVDNSGNLIGGVPGDDLRIFGKVGNYAGVLLTGEIQQFGFHDGYYDEYDFVFKLTGGELMPYFESMDGGVYVLSLGSSFTGDFTTNFGGYASGYLGPVERPGISLDTFISVEGAGQEPYGHNADQAPGIEIALGDAVTWTYVVTNIGSVPLADVTVTDDNATPGDTSDDFNPAPITENGFNIGDTDTDGLLDAGEAWLYRHWDLADTEGQFAGVSKVAGYYPARNKWVQDEDATNYHAALPAIDVTLTGEKPKVLMMRYTGDGPEATSHSQDPKAVSVTGDPNDTPLVHIIAADKRDLSHRNVKTFFDGEVALGELFAIDAAEAGADRLSSTTFIFIHDPSGNLLQTAKFHTSCSQPLALGDQFGAAKLCGYLGEGGSRHGLVPVEMLTSLSGFVYEDFNNDGLVNFNERGIENVQVTLSGTNDRGEMVERTETTDQTGAYFFDSLRPGNYTITEVSQPFGYADGIDTLGTAGGVIGDGPQIIDNGDSGFAAIGSWVSVDSVPGYLNDIHYSNAGSGSDVATWSFDVIPGSYQVAATWYGTANRATDAPYTVLDGSTPLGTVDVNQELVPDDFTDQGVGWEILGTFDITGTSLVVELSDNANQFVIADGLRIERLADGVQIIDNGDSGFAAIGSWVSVDSVPGYLNDIHYSNAGSGSDIAKSSFDVSPGSYQVAATWYGTANRATDAPYTVLDGSTPLGTVDVNQELVPDDFTDQGVGWEILGTFDITGTTLVVELSDDANQFVIADGVRIESVGQMSPGVTITESPGSTNMFTDIDLKADADGANYNFGKQPADEEVTANQTATIEFWAGKKGQDLLKKLNGGKKSKQLGNWLAATFPNMYKKLAGKDNKRVARTFMHLFKKAMKEDKHGKAKKQDKHGRGRESEAQMMATALAAYATNSSLAGYIAQDYGFAVSRNGLGATARNVGTSGAAFGVADDTEVTVMDLLLAANERAQKGKGKLSSQTQRPGASLRSLANEVFKAINEFGA